MNHAFLQLELDEQSHYITSFATHQGIHRFKRLNFGMTSASEELQIRLENILRGIKNCKNLADDIIIFAKEKVELNEAINEVLQRLADHNLTLNLEKCEFYKSEIEFYGFKFSRYGISASEDKIRAIKNLPPPTNTSEVRSFLGMMNFLSRFIPNYSEISSPLRHLTKKGVPWTWETAQASAFEHLKDKLSSNTTMSYFDSNKKTTIITDAGPTGISAILFQHTNDHDYRPVAYSSRSLTDVEQRYSQMEKECLAILHGCEKFRLYLIGDVFEICTDHKPLVTLLSNPRTTVPLRIERCFSSTATVHILHQSHSRRF